MCVLFILCGHHYRHYLRELFGVHALRLRVELLNRHLDELVVPGTVIIADLTDPMLDPESANGIFQVLLEQFRDTDVPYGKLCVFDEAHKYLSGAKSLGLTNAIVDTVRQMRHYGMRVAISTQSPVALPPEVLELTTIAILHRFHSRDWFEYISKKIPLQPDISLAQVQQLEPGQALVFASTHELDTAVNATDDCIGGKDGGHGSDFVDLVANPPTSVFKVQLRKRLTGDGGASRTNHRRKKAAPREVSATVSVRALGSEST